MEGISSTILENHLLLSELTLSSLPENRQALYEFFMQGLLLSTSEQRRFSVKRIQHDKFQLQLETRGNVWLLNPLQELVKFRSCQKSAFCCQRVPTLNYLLAFLQSIYIYLYVISNSCVLLVYSTFLDFCIRKTLISLSKWHSAFREHNVSFGKCFLHCTLQLLSPWGALVTMKPLKL